MPESDVSWRDYVDIRLEALEKTLLATVTANSLAVTKAEQAIEYRLANLNEFRQSLSDQTKTYVTKVELESEREGRIADVKSLQKTFYTVSAALAVIVVVLMFFIR